MLTLSGIRNQVANGVNGMRGEPHAVLVQLIRENGGLILSDDLMNRLQHQDPQKSSMEKINTIFGEIANNKQIPNRVNLINELTGLSSFIATHGQEIQNVRNLRQEKQDEFSRRNNRVDVRVANTVEFLTQTVVKNKEIGDFQDQYNTTLIPINEGKKNQADQVYVPMTSFGDDWKIKEAKRNEVLYTDGISSCVAIIVYSHAENRRKMVHLPGGQYKGFADQNNHVFKYLLNEFNGDVEMIIAFGDLYSESGRSDYKNDVIKFFQENGIQEVPINVIATERTFAFMPNGTCAQVDIQNTNYELRKI